MIAQNTSFYYEGFHKKSQLELANNLQLSYNSSSLRNMETVWSNK